VTNQVYLQDLAPYFSSNYNNLIRRTATLPEVPTEGWADEFVILIRSEIIKRPIKAYSASIIPESKGYTVYYASDPETREKEPLNIILFAEHFQPLIKLVDTPVEILPHDDLYMKVQHKYIRPALALKVSESIFSHLEK
jgi:hypothetical protein